MEDSPVPPVDAATRRYPTVRGLATGLVGVSAASLLFAAVVTNDGDGFGVDAEAGTTSQDRTDTDVVHLLGEGTSDAVDLEHDAVKHLVLDLTWDEMSNDEREEFCSDYVRVGLIDTYELFAASYGGEGAPSLTVFRRWVEPRCGAGSPRP